MSSAAGEALNDGGARSSLAAGAGVEEQPSPSLFTAPIGVTHGSPRRLCFPGKCLIYVSIPCVKGAENDQHDSVSVLGPP